MTSCLLLSLLTSLSLKTKQIASLLVLIRFSPVVCGSGCSLVQQHRSLTPAAWQAALINSYHTWRGNRRPGLISRRDEKDGEKERKEGERERRLKIKTRKTLLTELLTPAYLFMGLLKRTLEQSVLPSSQQPCCCLAPDRLLSTEVECN